MPVYTFEIAPFLAGRSVTVRDAAGSTVASGTLDANAKFTVPLGVGDYVASASDGRYTYRASGVVDQGDPDRLTDSALSAAYASKSAVMATVGGTAVAALGNSIEEGGTSNATQVFGSKSWANAMCLRSGGRLRLVRNAGISGETMAQMLTRFDTDVTPYRPAVVLLGSGENDLKAEFGLTPAQCVDRAAALVDKTRSIGALPVLHTTVPRGSVVTLARIVEFNDRLVRYAQANGVPILDFYSLLVSEADGTLYATSAYQSDGTHPTTEGAAAIADYALNKLLPYLPPGDVFLTRSSNDPLNLFTNALFLTDTNADGVADGWSKAGAEVTASLVSVSGVPGKMAQLERTTTGSVRATLMQSVTASGGKFAPGDRMAVAHRIQAEGSTAAYNGLYGIFTGGTGSFKSWDLGRGPITDGVGYYEFTVPAGTTSIDFYVAQDPGVGKVRIGQMTLRNLTQLGIA